MTRYLRQRIENCFGQLEERFSEAQLVRMALMDEKDFWFYHKNVCIWIRSVLLNGGILYWAFVREGIYDKRTMAEIVLHEFYLYKVLS